jgi:VWFA-related protein
VSGLGPENFRVFEGCHQVSIVSFGIQDQPITVGLIFDCSRSMQEKFRIAREAPRELFQKLNADDESFLITIADKAELRQALTSNFDELQTSLIFTQPRGMTSLLDGIYMGLQQIRKARNPRKAIVVVSDGGDNNSRYTLRDVEKIAVEADTQGFPLACRGCRLMRVPAITIRSNSRTQPTARQCPEEFYDPAM